MHLLEVLSTRCVCNAYGQIFVASEIIELPFHRPNQRFKPHFFGYRPGTPQHRGFGPNPSMHLLDPLSTRCVCNIFGQIRVVFEITEVPIPHPNEQGSPL